MPTHHAPVPAPATAAPATAAPATATAAPATAAPATATAAPATAAPATATAAPATAAPATAAQAPVPAPATAAPVAASRALRDAILAWYAVRGRDLAFRGTTDPYAILVSEAMAQQTQAARAAGYWTRFLDEFPTVHALAAATPAAVLRAWRGLGYNRRAIALRRAAIAIVQEHGGVVPHDLDALERLPGVGPYTARAVAALAFRRRVGAVDVNVRRVLARSLGGSLDAFSAADLQAAADASVPTKAPGVWTHALMDVGATFCKPRDPLCGGCPARGACRYAASGMPAARGLPLDPGPGRIARERPVRERPARERPARERPARERPARERRAPFRTTSRWLRGQILDLLRDSPDDAWAPVPMSIGLHGDAAVAAALVGLERDGLIQRHPDDPGRARLPID
ncbi:MAG: A/G-specific adenine glycosylase [Chloroflexota bacterium]